MSLERSSISRGIVAGIAAAAIAGVVGLADTASASTTIYNQTFSSTASGVLTGTVPTHDTGNAKWELSGASGSDWLASGAAPASSGSYPNAAEYLPLTVQANNIYTLTVTGLSPDVGTTGNWLAVGFLNSTSKDLVFGGSTQGPFMLLRDNGYIQAFGGPSISAGASFNNENNGSGVGPYTHGGTATVTLNTTGPESEWTATFAYNGSTLGSISYGGATSLPSTDLGVGFASYDSMQGSVGSITLTQTAVPEPAALGVLAVGGLGLLILKRRKTV